jgi:hypothetical protein
MANDGAVIAAGKEAWLAIKSQSKMTADMWLKVGHAVLVLRTKAMREAGVNAPVGGAYTPVMSRLLKENGFADMGQSELSRAAVMAENEAAIRKWLGSLEWDQRRRLNHPESILLRWKGTRRVQGPRAAKPRIESDQAKTPAPSPPAYTPAPPVAATPDPPRPAQIPGLENWRAAILVCRQRLAEVSDRATPLDAEVIVIAVASALGLQPPAGSQEAQKVIKRIGAGFEKMNVSLPRIRALERPLP